jgi:hypothetical protein
MPHEQFQIVDGGTLNQSSYRKRMAKRMKMFSILCTDGYECFFKDLRDMLTWIFDPRARPLCEPLFVFQEYSLQGIIQSY